MASRPAATRIAPTTCATSDTLDSSESPESSEGSPFIGIVLALVSAALYSAAFAPIDWPYLGWVALAPLLVGLAHTPPRWGFAIGWAWALAIGCGTAFFVPKMLETYFDLTPIRALATFVVLVLVPGIWYAVFGAWYTLRRRWGPVSPFEIAGIWGACEWARASTLFANPWSLSGYSQANVLPVLQGVSVFGVVGLGMLLALVNATLATPLLPERDRPRTRSLVASLALLVLWIGYGLAEIERGPDDAATIHIGLVQPDLPRSVRTDRRADALVVSRLMKLSEVAVRAGSDLIVWPEYAIERVLDPGSATDALLAEFTSRSGVGLLLGTIGERNGGLANSTILFESGQRRGRYDKVLLMPLGESEVGARWVDRLGPWVVPGTDRDPLQSSLGSIGVLACNEVMSSSAARTTIANGAGLLVNLANDDWFGPSGMLPQMRLASLRAVENRRYLVRATHSGITAVIDPIGRVTHQAVQGEAGVLVGEVQMSSARSLYSIWGDAPVLLLATGAALRSALAWMRRRRGLARKSPPTG